MFRFRRTERVDRATLSEPQASQPQVGAGHADENHPVQNQTVQVSSVRETINLLEPDLGAMIGDVQQACELVCREAEDSAAATDRITRKTDSLVMQAGSASRDLSLFAAAIEELAHSSHAIGSQVRKADDLTDLASTSATL